MATLVIENVDLELLELQRKDLNRLLDVLNVPGVGAVNVRKAVFDCHETLVGIEAMLDEWSDKKYFQKEVKKNVL